MNNAPKYEGERFLLGGRELCVPGLSVRQVKEHRAALAQIPSFANADPTDEQIDQLTQVIHAAISRNHPDVTLDEVQDAVDLRTLPRIVRAVMGQTNAATKPGEAGGPAPQAEVPSPSTGTP